MLEIIGLEKSYGGGLKVLKGLNMSVDKGSIYGFIGRNGCGKTTTMNIICSILKKDGGQIKIGVDGNPNNVKIGYLPESPTLYGYMNPVEYLRFISACCEYKGDVEQRIAEVLETVGLTYARRRKLKGFSRGMTQKVGIAASIFNNPELLLLDEPTSALDPQGRTEVMNIIEKLKEAGSTIILSTHILSDVERIADKVGIMNDGVIVLEGSIRELIERTYGSSSNATNVTVKTLKPLDDEKLQSLSSSGFTNIQVNKDMTNVTFTFDGSDADVEQVTKKLVEIGIVPQSINLEGCSLEEIYFKYTNQKKRV